jgi:hypothetical protein
MTSTSTPRRGRCAARSSPRWPGERCRSCGRPRRCSTWKSPSARCAAVSEKEVGLPSLSRWQPRLGLPKVGLAQRLGCQLQPFIAVLPLRNAWPTCICWANLTSFSLELAMRARYWNKTRIGLARAIRGPPTGKPSQTFGPPTGTPSQAAQSWCGCRPAAVRMHG